MTAPTAVELITIHSGWYLDSDGIPRCTCGMPLATDYPPSIGYGLHVRQHTQRRP